MKKLIIFLVATVFSGSLLAASLGDLKGQGVIGELPNGYLGLIKSNSEAQKLVADVNAKRKAIYKKQAAKNKIALSEVEKIAAKRNFQKTKAGHYIKVSGKWIKK